MGWKSTIDITRNEAIRLLMDRITSDISNTELADMLGSSGFGDDTNLEYFGYNFNVIDKMDDE